MVKAVIIKHIDADGQIFVDGDYVRVVLTDEYVREDQARKKTYVGTISGICEDGFFLDCRPKELFGMYESRMLDVRDIVSISKEEE